MTCSPELTFLNRSLRRLTMVAIFALPATAVLADGAVVDKVYHPYVDALESEIEFRSLFQDSSRSNDNDKQSHRLAFGHSIGDRLFGEAYLVAARSRSGDFDIEAYELELKWQLTEQGQYAADWGLLFEWEDEFDADIRELSAGLLVEREFGRLSGTANLMLIQEWGDDIRDEFETAFSAQARYRLSRTLEPALEFYAGQDYRGLGPVFLGNLNLGIRRSLNWEAGIIFGADDDSPDHSYRLLLELEF